MLPVRWMSPESIMYGKFTLESDIWSYGVVLWEIYALGKQPYYGYTNEQVRANVRSSSTREKHIQLIRQVLKLILQGVLLTPPETAPPLVLQILNGCWKSWPSERWTFAEIHSKLVKGRPRSAGCNNSPPDQAHDGVTYVDIRHNETLVVAKPNGERNDNQNQSGADYLQPLPDLPFHLYSNTIAQMY